MPHILQNCSLKRLCVFTVYLADKDVKFVSYFWKTLWKLFGTQLKFSYAFHPQKNGQTEVTNHSLGDMLQSLVSDKPGNWDLVLPIGEFVYNNSVNRSIGMSPFQIVQGYNLKQPVNLIPLPLFARPSELAETFSRHLHDVHAEVRCNLALSNNKYKLAANAHRRHQEFDVGNYVMSRICPERFPNRPYKKLHPGASGSYRIAKKLEPNAYLLKLPSDMSISPIFNVEGLVSYRGTFEPPPLCSDDSTGTQFYHAPTPPLPSVAPTVEVIDAVMDEHMIFSSSGPTRHYLRSLERLF